MYEGGKCRFLQTLTPLGQVEYVYMNDIVYIDDICRLLLGQLTYRYRHIQHIAIDALPLYPVPLSRRSHIYFVRTVILRL